MNQENQDQISMQTTKEVEQAKNAEHSVRTARIDVRPEQTPNPQTMRFSTGIALTETPADFKSAKETARSPLARKLFGFPWTSGVYIGRDFVTVTKQDWVDWETLAEPLAGLITEHLERGEGVVVNLPSHANSDNKQSASAASSRSDDSSSNSQQSSSSDEPAVELIKRVLNDEIRPAVAMDGGNVVFSHYTDRIVYVFMQGSCAGCPSSTMTLKMGIEARLKEAVPEIIEVVSI